MSARKLLFFFVIVMLVVLQTSFIASAFAVEIKEPQTGGLVNVPTLPPIFGRISGTVTSEKTGAAINRATVTLYRQKGNKWNKEMSARTNASGQYSFNNRRPGNFRLLFKATSHKNEYFNNATTLKKATTISLTAGGAVTVNAALASRK